jgi:hypothetical protein
LEERNFREKSEDYSPFSRSLTFQERQINTEKKKMRRRAAEIVFILKFSARVVLKSAKFNN